MIGLAAFAAVLLMGGMLAPQTVSERGRRTVQEALEQLEKGALPAVGDRRATKPAAAKALRSFGHCIMMFPGRAVDILGTMPGSLDEYKLASDVAERRAGCLNSGSLMFGPSLLRGIVAESLLRRDFGGVGGGRRHGPVAIYAMPQAQDRADLPSRVRASLQLQDFSSCVLGKASDKVAHLLASEPAGEEEAKVWQSLAGVMNGCIDPHQQFKMSELQLRGSLAEAAYRAAVQRVGATREEARR